MRRGSEGSATSAEAGSTVVEDTVSEKAGTVWVGTPVSVKEELATEGKERMDSEGSREDTRESTAIC
jgi:hypothetical protein